MPKPQATLALLPMAALARQYQVSAHLIGRAVKAGEIDSVRIAGRVYLKSKSAHAWGRRIIADTAPASAVA